MTKPVITISDVSKKFRIHKIKETNIKYRVIKFLKQEEDYYEDFIALKSINLDIEKGTTVGLIGANGSGKSTLLKLICKILYPDSGKIVTTGKVSALMELGAGFHPELSGKDNIYLNSSILCINKKEIDEKMHEIVDFAELGDFIDNPVKSYSSGMYARLGFSVAINVNPDILLIDEVLAVGDESFQKKCLEKIENMKQSGKTIVIVSHSSDLIERTTDRTIVLKRGEIYYDGAPERGVMEYHGLLLREQKMIHVLPSEEKALPSAEIMIADEESLKENKKAVKPISEAGEKDFTNIIKIKNVKFLDKSGVEKLQFTTGEEINMIIDYEVIEDVKEPLFRVQFFNEENILCHGTNTKRMNMKLGTLSKDGSFKINYPSMLLLEGIYYVSIGIWVDEWSSFPYSLHEKAYKLVFVSERAHGAGISAIPHTWLGE
ncbi:ABC transporter ATP-binding protein [bacterium]|nr:ABC transporter ATP-binding protein [bacterium]